MLNLGLQDWKGNKQLIHLVQGSFMALTIKIGAAGLSFLMFVALARAMSVNDFGRFGFAFSLATILAVIGSFGQRALVLRFAAIYEDAGDQARLLGVARFGYRLVIIGCGVLGIILICAGFVWPGLENRGMAIAVGAFTLVLGIAEYQTCLMRVFSGMVLALLPRDILWRLGVIIPAGLAAFGFLPLFSVNQSLWMITVILAGVTLAQTLCHPLTRPPHLLKAKAIYETAQWRAPSLGLWGTSFVQMAMPNLSVVIVGLMLSPTETGAFFAAWRISMLLNLFLLATNMILAPIFSKTVHKGDIQQAQTMLSLIALFIGLGNLACLAFIIHFKVEIMGLFAPEFATHTELLIALAIGQSFIALTGPTITIMEMTGHEKGYLKLSTFINLTGLALLPWVTLHFHALGAAIILSLTYICLHITLLIFIRRKLYLYPSILGIRKLFHKISDE